jgi:hypothetical protein
LTLRPEREHRKVLVAEAVELFMDRQQLIALVLVSLMLFSSVAYAFASL